MKIYWLFFWKHFNLTICVEMDILNDLSVILLIQHMLFREEFSRGKENSFNGFKHRSFYQRFQSDSYQVDSSQIPVLEIWQLSAWLLFLTTVNLDSELYYLTAVSRRLLYSRNFLIFVSSERTFWLQLAVKFFLRVMQ